MAAAVAKIHGPLGGLDAVSVDPNRLFVNQRSLLPLCRIRVRLRLRAPRNDHEDRFAPAFVSGTEDRTYLESLIRDDFERCHPGETLEDLKRRASFSKEDRGLLRDWMAVAAARAAAASRANA